VLDGVSGSHRDIEAEPIRSLLRFPCFGHEQIACRGRNVGGFVFAQQIRPCATSTLIELIWLSEISDSSVQILEQIEMPVNPGRGKMADSVPFSLRRPMAAHLLSESPFVSRKKCAV
jgi:hypothetical protein